MTTNGDSDEGMQNVESHNQNNKAECANCPKIKAIWKEHLKKEVNKISNELKQKHEAEKNKLHKEIENLKKELERRKDEKIRISNEEKNNQRVRGLIENNKIYRRQSEEIVNELMVELKKSNKLKVDTFCQTDAVIQVAQYTQMGRPISIDPYIQNMTEIANKKKQLDESIGTVMEIKTIVYRQISAEYPAPQQIIQNKSTSNAKRARIKNAPPSISQFGNEQFEEDNDSDASFNSDIQIIESESKTANSENRDQIDNNMDTDEGGELLLGQIKQRTISEKENDVADIGAGQNLHKYLKSCNHTINSDEDNNKIYGKIVAKFGAYSVACGHDPSKSSGELVVNDYLNYISDNNTMQRRQELYKEGLLREVKKWKDNQKSKDID